MNDVQTIADIKTIFGGFLLGIVYDVDVSSPMGFNFIAWDGLSSKGGFLPAATCVVWDKIFKYCAIMFSDSFSIFTFK